MESRIKIKASKEEMSIMFNDTSKFLVKWYEEIKEGLFFVIIRHEELKTSLTGTFTPESFLNKLRSVKNES